MNSESPEIISLSPLVSKLVKAVIKHIRYDIYHIEDKQSINADLVPKFSEKVMNATMEKKSLEKQIFNIREREKRLINELESMPKQERKINFIQPVNQNKPVLNNASLRPQYQRPKPLPFQMPQNRPEPTIESLPPILGYGKLDPLIHDPSVYIIECEGPNKNLTILRSGQKQPTRISLFKAEIEQILQKISEEVHIPLLEGVFRAAVEGFSINAIISETVGTRFVIKKQR